MNPKDLRIVFMGTPQVAVQSLRDLVENSYNVVGVITATDKPAGRGRKVAASPVKEYALSRNIPVLQPENLKAPEFLEQLKALKPDIQVVVAFRMLPQQVWALPPLGTFNMHASLLPQYRGAAPINRVIINGERETGVTTFLLDQHIDTGKIMLQQKIPIEKNETAGSLHDKIMHQGSLLVMKTIDLLAKGEITPVEQQELEIPESELKKAPKIFKEDCRINWNQPSQKVANLVHGLSPLPGAFTEIQDSEGKSVSLKIFEAEPQIISHDLDPGTLISDNKTWLGISTADGILWIKSLQLSGKRRMLTPELLRGYSFTNAVSWKK